MHRHVEYAEFCAAAYDRPTEYRDPDEVVCANIVPMEDTLVVVFRGTDPANLHDVLIDLDFRSERVNGLGVIEEGPWHALSDALPTLDALIASYPQRPFTFTGHSLGGWLALYMAAVYALRGAAIKEVVTFGAPRASADGVLEALFKKHNIAPTLYCAGADPIPHLRLELLGWRHPAPLTRMGVAQLSFDISQMLDDHYIRESYLPHVKSLFPEENCNV